jgi:1,2-diacylglycerol 3-beta-galactosyltransferase
VRITWCDPLIGQGRAVARRVSSLYPTIVKRSPATWGAIFRASNTAASFAAIRAAVRTQLRPVLVRHLAAADPDLVLSVHPLLNHVTADLLRRSPRPRALMTVVTDLVDLHRGWACRRADLVVVPTADAQAAALRLRIAPSRLRLMGMPIDLRFRPPRQGEPHQLRQRLGLDEGRPTVLVVGGGDGAGRLLAKVRALAEGSHRWQVIAVCGRNERLRHQLLGQSFRTPTLVLGFVDDMPDLMRAADLVVGKAGPGVIAEALATGLPIVVTSYLPGQEQSNARFVTDAGVGRYVPQPELLLPVVNELLDGEPEVYREMAARSTALACLHATLDIAAACLDLAASYSAASHASR